MTKITDEMMRASAQALCYQNGADPDEIIQSLGGPPLCKFAQWTLFEDAARAALEAALPAIRKAVIERCEIALNRLIFINDDEDEEEEYGASYLEAIEHARAAIRALGD
jgi:hypothetical protein